MEITVFNGKTHCKLPVSIAMLVYQRKINVFFGNTQYDIWVRPKMGDRPCSFDYLIEGTS